MWNLKKAASEEEGVVSTRPASSSRGPSMMMNPYEITKQELVRKLKFFAIYVGSIVLVPKLLRSLGFLAPLGIPLTRR